MTHGKAHPHKTSTPDDYPLLDDRTTPYIASFANADIAIQDGSGGDMTVVTDDRIMLDKCSGIEDAVVAHPGTRIDNCTVHHNAARTNGCVSGNMSEGRNDRRQLKPEFKELPMQADPVIWRLDLTDGNESVPIGFGQLRQIAVCPNDSVAKVPGMHLLLHADQTRNLILTALLDDIDARMGMASSPDQNQIRFSHGTNPALLGILIRHCDNNCAFAKSMRGQSLNGIN